MALRVGMYADVIKHCASCPQCAIVNLSGRMNKPPLHPIPVQRVFQIIGVDVMDLPRKEAGNKHVVVFQDFLSKWPFVFPVPDQKAVQARRQGGFEGVRTNPPFGLQCSVIY